MKYTEALEIPAQCQKCPVLRSVGGRYDHLTDGADSIIMGMMSGSSKEQVIAQLINSGIEPDEAARVVAEGNDEFHKLATTEVDRIDAMRDACVSLGRKTVDACDPRGTLSMRATRDGQEVTATVCMSEMANKLGVMGEFEPTEVRRRTIK